MCAVKRTARSRAFGDLFGVGDRRDDPDQGAIGAVVADGIGQHIGLGLVLVGDAAAVRLIPVDDELSGLARC